MRFAFQTGLAVTACLLTIYGCSSSDDGTPQGHAGMASAGKGGTGSAGKGSAGNPSTGGASSGGTSTGGTNNGGTNNGGDAGRADDGGHGGIAPEGSGGHAAGATSGDGGQAGTEPGTAGGAGEAGADATGCIQSLTGRYALRLDSTIRYEPGAGDVLVKDGATGNPLQGVLGIADGSYHGCALLSDKTVKCWQTDASYGNNEGQLGNGTTSPSVATFSATRVLTNGSGALSNLVALAHLAPSTQYSNNTCAIDGDGGLWCWGDLTWTANGGTSLHTGYAEAVTLDGTTPLTGVIQASIAKEFACALVQNTPNQVWCWGINGSGNLAQGDTTKRQYPVRVLGLSAPIKVVTAMLGGDENTACALDDGQVRCWGYNATSGAAGNGTTTAAVQSPALVVKADGTTALAGVTELVSGYSSFAALLPGSIWVWGTHFANYAADYGVANVSLLGSSGGLSNMYGVRYVTTDGLYHDAMRTLPVSCGSE